MEQPGDGAGRGIQQGGEAERGAAGRDEVDDPAGSEPEQGSVGRSANDRGRGHEQDDEVRPEPGRDTEPREDGGDGQGRHQDGAGAQQPQQAEPRDHDGTFAAVPPALPVGAAGSTTATTSSRLGRTGDGPWRSR